MIEDPVSLLLMIVSYLLSTEVVTAILEFILYSYEGFFTAISPIGELLFGPAWQWAGFLFAWPLVIIMLLLGYFPTI